MISANEAERRLRAAFHEVAESVVDSNTGDGGGYGDLDERHLTGDLIADDGHGLNSPERGRSWVVATAAVVVILLTIGTIWLGASQPPPGEVIAADAPNGSVGSMAPGTLEYGTVPLVPDPKSDPAGGSAVSLAINGEYVELTVAVLHTEPLDSPYVMLYVADTDPASETARWRVLYEYVDVVGRGPSELVGAIQRSTITVSLPLPAALWVASAAQSENGLAAVPVGDSVVGCIPSDTCTYPTFDPLPARNKGTVPAP